MSNLFNTVSTDAFAKVISSKAIFVVFFTYIPYKSSSNTSICGFCPLVLICKPPCHFIRVPNVDGLLPKNLYK